MSSIILPGLAAQGIIVKFRPYRGVAEKANGADKDVGAVIDVADKAGLARKVVKLELHICIKG